MKFAWAFIVMITIAYAIEEVNPDQPLYRKHEILTNKETESAEDHPPDDHMQLNFFDHLFDYTEKAVNTSIACTPHALRLALGISCLYSNNQSLTYMLMRASGVAWILYHLRIGTNTDGKLHDDPPFMKSVYFKSFIYSGLAYTTNFYYFTHLGALHITQSAFSYWYTQFTTPKNTESENETRTETETK